MTNNEFLEGIERQLTLISNEFDVIVKKPLVESDRNEGLLSACYGLLTQAKAQLLLLEIEDRKEDE